MTTIREEIQERIILMMTADWGGTEVEATEDIIKLFEKRIDELWNKKQKQIYSTFQQSPTYESAYEEAIEEIKEILKK